MFDLALVIPIVAIVFFFGAIVMVVKYVTEGRTARRRMEAEGGTQYRRLAEEAVAHQRRMNEAVEDMNRTLKEIERILREV